MPRGIANIKQVPKLLHVAGQELPAPFCRLIERLLAHLKELDRQTRELEEQIVDWHERSEPMPSVHPCTRLPHLTIRSPATLSSRRHHSRSGSAA
jgi:transposase